jgi:molybdopterin-guanine dinucleotide biosynthesis protein A
LRRLGAIFAGGLARRFGSDKAAALADGIALIDRVATGLAAQCDKVVVVGRSWPGLETVPDAPEPGLGPLGALAGALVYAGEHGYTQVLTSGCDLPDLPPNLVAMLSPGPGVVAGQPLLGLWPAELAPALLDHLARSDDRSMRGWIAVAGARRVPFAGDIANINTPADLATFVARKTGD